MSPLSECVDESAAEVSRFLAESERREAVKLTLHLIGNAHLDPVWLWDWREGMNESIATCRAMVALLREFPEFRFIRGEAAVYDYIERHDPALFADIRSLVAEGRWDIVGGNWVQPDTNLPCTEALSRQFIRGKRYFREKFGVEVTAAWAADSFGHSAGLPEILAAAGMESFACTRPQDAILPISTQAFWWRGRSGVRVLAYRPRDGWYASERAALGKRLDACLANAEAEGLRTAALFYGLGNHGGGPSRAHLREIREWAAAHPEVEVRHSGLHDFFADLRAELAWRGEDAIETHEGELNFCLRGCSASVARFKYVYRRAEARLLRAERTAVVTGLAGDSQRALQGAWDTLLFNAFHDILPGSGIERAYDDQLAQVGGVLSDAQRVETDALLALSSRIDTRAGSWPVPEDHPLSQPVLVWNPHPWTLRRQVEVEVSLDYRPLWQYENRLEEIPVAIVEAATGKQLPMQVIAEEHDSFRHIPWRRRAVVPVEVPPMGWTLLQMGLCDPKLANANGVNGRLSVASPEFGCEASPGSQAVLFTRNGVSWLAPGLQVRLYEDTWGAWGGMTEEQDSWLLTKECERLVVADVAVLESGPLRSAFWVRFEGGTVRSTLEVTFYMEHGVGHIEMRVRAYLMDRGMRMKLVIPAGGASGEAEFSVPGGTVRRGPCGEVPGGRWVRAGAGKQTVGFASDALYGFDTTENELRATIARSSRYASDVNQRPADRPWQPCADLGEHVFRALLTPDWNALPQLAEELEEPPVILTVPQHEGNMAARGSLMKLEEPLRLLALEQSCDAILVRLQNAGRECSEKTSFVWRGEKKPLAPLQPGEITTVAVAGHPSRRGFTLIELLATIAIVSVLAVLLFGAVNKIRDQADSMKAVSSLKKLTVGAISYANENGGFFPTIYIGTDISWAHTLVMDGYLGLEPTDDRSKAIQYYYKNFDNPITRRQASAKLKKRYTQGVFGMNAFKYLQGLTIPADKRTSINGLKRPSSVALFADGTWNSNSTYFGWALVDPSVGSISNGAQYANTLSGGYAHYSFVDGSVRKIPAQNADDLSSPPVGFGEDVFFLEPQQ